MSDVKDLLCKKSKKELSLSEAISLLKDRKLTKRDNRQPIMARTIKKKLVSIVKKNSLISKKDLYNSLKFKNLQESGFERSLRKLATKGTVKLFNSINKPQE
eukprot:NODE_27_length_39007_cov_1.590650.p35 type:complete len:102 gc:universal NODE_27_length_39007_cov_1.590650:668-363(-)